MQRVCCNFKQLSALQQSLFIYYPTSMFTYCIEAVKAMTKNMRDRCYEKSYDAICAGLWHGLMIWFKDLNKSHEQMDDIGQLITLGD